MQGKSSEASSGGGGVRGVGNFTEREEEARLESGVDGAAYGDSLTSSLSSLLSPFLASFCHCHLREVIRGSSRQHSRRRPLRAARHRRCYLERQPTHPSRSDSQLDVPLGLSFRSSSFGCLETRSDSTETLSDIPDYARTAPAIPKTAPKTLERIMGGGYACNCRDVALKCWTFEEALAD
ncbi:hypothetical protein AAHA92_25432 [Salvia divinorum]|uniref:Uncharacterized protein n=1 Tax=Salvia divinorum TaxID=28513 RepID=A0ABD1GDU5_SALDI